jgi:IS5 family transposase
MPDTRGRDAGYPETFCIAKGKAGKPYEFGCKVAAELTYKQDLVLSSQELHENQYEGYTLKSNPKKAEALSGAAITKTFV